MIYVGIDVAKDKHDCFITNSDGEVLFKSFTISNNREGFESLFPRIRSVSDDLTKVKVGLEATGHYSYNLLGFLLDNGLPTFVINPLHTNLYRKSLSLRKTKTDKVDAHTIAVNTDNLEHSARRFRAALPPFQSSLSALLSTPFRKSSAYLSGDECNDRFSIPPESRFRAL